MVTKADKCTYMVLLIDTLSSMVLLHWSATDNIYECQFASWKQCCVLNGARSNYWIRAPSLAQIYTFIHMVVHMRKTDLICHWTLTPHKVSHMWWDIPIFLAWNCVYPGYDESPPPPLPEPHTWMKNVFIFWVSNIASYVCIDMCDINSPPPPPHRPKLHIMLCIPCIKV